MTDSLCHCEICGKEITYHPYTPSLPAWKLQNDAETFPTDICRGCYDRISYTMNLISENPKLLDDFLSMNGYHVEEFMYD